MTGLNHAATGVLVAVIVKQPALALPLAFLSHFAVDAVPHFDHKDLLLRPRLFRTVVGLDAVLTVLLLVILAGILNIPSWLVIASGLLATLPDLMWLSAILRGKIDNPAGENLLAKINGFHKNIQSWEGSRGAYVEIVWFSVILAFILKIGR